MNRNCRSCEEPISAVRLAALPRASYCRDCQEERESTNPIRRSGVVDTTGVLLLHGEQMDPAEEARR